MGNISDDLKQKQSIQWLICEVYSLQILPMILSKKYFNENLEYNPFRYGKQHWIVFRNLLIKIKEEI